MMAKSECVCENRGSFAATQKDTRLPTFTDLESGAALFQEHGYVVVRNLFSAEEVQQACSEISAICSQWYDNYLKTGGKEDESANEIANRRPAWRDGSWRPAPGQEELGFRKLFRMTLQSEFFARKAKHEKVKFSIKYQKKDINFQYSR